MAFIQYIYTIDVFHLWFWIQKKYERTAAFAIILNNGLKHIYLFPANSCNVKIGFSFDANEPKSFCHDIRFLYVY